MAEIVWKGIKWKAAHGELSVPELLTVLKGFGPMEVLEFDKPGQYHGQLTLCLTEEGNKEITLYFLEVYGERTTGLGRSALVFLKKIFNGDLVVEDPGSIRIENATEQSLLFWVKMFREGLIDVLDYETCELYPGIGADELDEIERNLERLAKSNGLSGRQ